jgi:hypothetical protein
VTVQRNGHLATAVADGGLPRGWVIQDRHDRTVRATGEAARSPTLLGQQSHLSGQRRRPDALPVAACSLTNTRFVIDQPLGNSTGDFANDARRLSRNPS